MCACSCVVEVCVHALASEKANWICFRMSQPCVSMDEACICFIIYSTVLFSTFCFTKLLMDSGVCNHCASVH